MWLIRFVVFCVHEYRFHAYILTITVRYFNKNQNEKFWDLLLQSHFFNDYNDLIKML